VELFQLRKRVGLRLATHSQFELFVDDFQAKGNPPPSKLLSAMVEDSSIASVNIVRDGVLEVFAKSPGETILKFKGIANGKEVDERVPLIVQTPNALNLTQACPTPEPYWVGLPAMLRFDYWQVPRPDGLDFEPRIWGAQYFPLHPETPLKILPNSSNGFEWALEGLEEPGDVKIRGEFPDVEGHLQAEISLSFLSPPKIIGSEILEISTGAILGAEVQGPAGHEHILRAFPVGEGGQKMCNTIAAFDIQSKTPTCMVRPLDASPYVPSAKANTANGMFAVAAEEPGNECEIEVTFVPTPPYQVVESAKLTRTLIVRTY
jgi:hypothetical protein